MGYYDDHEDRMFRRWERTFDRVERELEVKQKRRLIWHSQDGSKWTPQEMETRHLKACIALSKKRNQQETVDILEAELAEREKRDAESHREIEPPNIPKF